MSIDKNNTFVSICITIPKVNTLAFILSTIITYIFLYLTAINQLHCSQKNSLIYYAYGLKLSNCTK